jgi:hypothetical protein
MLANVETLSITYFKLDFDFSTDRIFAQSFSLQFFCLMYLKFMSLSQVFTHT